MQLWKGGASVRKPSVSQIIQTTRDIAASFEMQFGPRRARSLQVAGASCIVSAGAGMGKLAMGLISLSLFTCVSAFYSFAMVVAKVVGDGAGGTNPLLQAGRAAAGRRQRAVHAVFRAAVLAPR